MPWCRTMWSLRRRVAQSHRHMCSSGNMQKLLRAKSAHVLKAAGNNNSADEFFGSSITPAFLRKEATIAPPGFNRWLAVPPGMAVQLCVGSAYAWSLFTLPLSRAVGVVTVAAEDWSLMEIAVPYSLSIACLGLGAAFGGKWLEKAGPRLASVAGAAMWGSGLMLGGLGVEMHNLWVMYAGYGLLAGCGIGISYIAPVSTMIRWFPDRKGLATGLAVCGFGGGTMLAKPLYSHLMGKFSEMPTYVGQFADLDLVTQAGQRFIEISGELKEVVVASHSDCQSALMDGVVEHGVYIAGSGSTGVGATLMTVGALHGSVMLASAFAFRVKGQQHAEEVLETKVKDVFSAVDLNGDGVISRSEMEVLLERLAIVPTDGTKNMMEKEWSRADRNRDGQLSYAEFVDYYNRLVENHPGAVAETAGMVQEQKAKEDKKNNPFDVTLESTMRTPQFWLLWGTTCLFASGGNAVLGSGTAMLTEVFGPSCPDIATPALAATFVGTLSFFNMSGRLGWAAASDYLTPKRTFALYGLFVPICLAVPALAASAADTGSAVPLAVFCGSLALATTFYGGTYAVLPAYLAKLFGTRDVGAIHGRALTSVSVATFAGPATNTFLRQQSYDKAVDELVQKVDPAVFEQTFGASVADLALLVEAKTVTIASLMDIAPAGTIDPTTMLYDNSMYALGGMMAAGFALNLCITPVASKFHHVHPKV